MLNLLILKDAPLWKTIFTVFECCFFFFFGECVFFLVDGSLGIDIKNKLNPEGGHMAISIVYRMMEGSLILVLRGIYDHIICFCRTNIF